jgi:hypothetical protein
LRERHNIGAMTTINNVVSMPVRRMAIEGTA